MVTAPLDLVTTTALKRYRANRRTFAVRDRMGDTQHLFYSEGHPHPYAAHNITTRKVRAFATVIELQKYLREGVA